MAATPPGARRPPKRSGGLNNTLQGLDLAAAGDIVDPGTLALLGMQQANPPEQAPVSGGPGVLSTLLAGIGGGLAGQPGAGAGIVQQQQEQIAQIERENRALLQQHREQTLALVQSGIKERTRQAERAQDKKAEALALTRQAEIDQANALVRASRQRVNEMRENQLLTEEQADQIPASITDLILEVGDVADQLDRTLDDPETLQFDVGITDPETGQTTKFRSAEDLRNTFNLIKSDLLRGIVDQKARAEISKDFDKAFGPIETRLKAFERRIAAASKAKLAKEEADRAKKVKTARRRAQVTKTIRTQPKSERAAFGGDF